LELAARDFAFYDIDNRQWKVEEGAYDILVGFSASDIVKRVAVTLDRCVVPRDYRLSST
jgi:beta-glucosidase